MEKHKMYDILDKNDLRQVGLTNLLGMGPFSFLKLSLTMTNKKILVP
jgi:hypothetical protein